MEWFKFKMSANENSDQENLGMFVWLLIPIKLLRVVTFLSWLLKEGDIGAVWTPQHRKKFCRTPHHRKKSRWITVTAISIFSLMILASVQDKAFKILPLTLRKSLKQHITSHNEAVVTLPMPFDLGCYVYFDSRILEDLWTWAENYCCLVLRDVLHPV